MSSNSFNNGMGGNGTSFFEQLTYWTIKAYFYNQYDVQLHYKLGAYEFDVAIPALNIIIECQSTLHANSIEMDKAKQNYCKEHNIRLITLMNWQDNLKVQINYQTDYIEVGCAAYANKEPVDKVLTSNDLLDFEKVKNQGNTHCRHIFAVYNAISLIEGKPADINKFCSLQWKLIWNKAQAESINKILPFENSLASKDKLVSEYRGLVKYGYINPREISLGSHEYTNWECNTCGYKWQAIVKSRTILNTECPKCAAKIASKKISITQSICKDISKSFYAKYKSLVLFIKANSMQEKEQLAKSTYASSEVKTITLICPHCQKERIITPHRLHEATNIRCRHCKRLFIE